MSTKASMWVVVTALAAVCLATTDAQNAPSCASNLVSCAAFMNVTKPPDSCCEPLKKAIETQLQCLCNIYTSPGLLTSFGINVTEALTLPSRCGIQGDLSACGTAQSPGSSTAPAGGTGTDKSGAERIGSAGTLGALVFLISSMLS